MADGPSKTDGCESEEPELLQLILRPLKDSLSWDKRLKALLKYAKRACSFECEEAKPIKRGGRA